MLILSGSKQCQFLHIFCGDDQGSEKLVCHSRHSRADNLRQWYLVYEQRVQTVRKSQWDSSAERAVQVVKSGLRKNSTGDINLQLARILFRYRNTPHATTGITPAELLIGRTPRTHLDFLYPDLAIQAQKKQERQEGQS